MNAKVMVLMCLLFVGVCSPGTRGQCDYSLTTYESSELVGYGAVSDLIVFDDGSGPALIAGGIELLPVPGGASDVYNIAKWTPEGGWAPLGEPNQLYYIRDLEVFEGQLYVANGVGGVHRWTGTAWVAVDEGLVGSPELMVVFDDGSGSGPSLFVSTNVSASPASRLLKLTDGAWQHVAEFNNGVSALKVFSGELMVAGYFTAVNGVPVNHIAAWDGKQWADLGADIDIAVGDLIVYELKGSPVLVASGSFRLVGGDTTNVAYWDGSAWFALPAIDVINEDGTGTLGVWDNGDGNGPSLYAAVASKEPKSGDTHETLVRFDISARQWHPLATTFYLPDSQIRCLQPYHEGDSAFPTLFVGGRFEFFGPSDSYNLARILPQPSGAILPIPSDPRSLRGTVSALAIFDDGNGAAAYAGGRLRGLGDAPSYTLVARFDGESWKSIGRGYQNVQTLKSLDDGSGPALYAAGSFYSIQPNNGALASYFARWNGTNWTGMGTPSSSRVTAMCVHDDGGGPAIYGTLSNDTLAKWNAPGTWTTIPGAFTAAGTFGASLNAIASIDDGSGPALYVAGRIDSVAGVPANNIARWRGPAGGWEAVGEGLPDDVSLLHVHDDGTDTRLIATGYVAQPGNLAQWDGQHWSAVGNLPSIGMNGSIRSITTFDDGSGRALVVSTLDGVARWNGLNWAFITQQSRSAFLPDGDVLYMGNPFSIWASGGEPLAINGITGGGSVEPGAAVALDADIVQGGAVTYAWRHNGTPVMNGSGYYDALTDRLRIYGTNGSHEGVYDVVVTNDCTSVTSEPVVIDVIGSCVGDITIDNAVRGDDLTALVGAWGECPPACPSDLTHDDTVDIDDLLLLISRWGACP